MSVRHRLQSGSVLRCTFVILLVGILGPQTIKAQQASLPSEVSVPGSVRHELSSTANGRHYKLSVFLPRGYESGTDRYPVLYVIPGETFGAFYAQLTRYLGQGDIPKLIVVGVDFTDSDSYSLDLPTAGPDPHWKVPDSRGAANFLEFFQRQLKPFVDAHYRTEPEDNGIMGHSMAGFFALYAFLHSQGVFQHVYASSPSTIWQNNRLLSDVREIEKAGPPLKGRAFVDEGSLEAYDGRLEALDREVTSAHFPGLKWTMRVAEGQSHRTVAFADGIDALYSIYGPEPRAVSAAELADLAGTYCTDRGQRFSLQAHNGKLFLIGWPDNGDDADARTELLTSEENEWFIRYLDYRMTTVRTERAAYHLIFHLAPTPGPNGDKYTPEVSATLCSTRSSPTASKP